jgi:hypothetical protein
MSKRSAEKWQKFIPEDDGGFTLETYQDPTAILNNNKIDYNNYGDKKTPGKMGEGIRVASIPITIWEKWMQFKAIPIYSRNILTILITNTLGQLLRGFNYVAIPTYIHW